MPEILSYLLTDFSGYVLTLLMRDLVMDRAANFFDDWSTLLTLHLITNTAGDCPALPLGGLNLHYLALSIGDHRALFLCHLLWHLPSEGPRHVFALLPCDVPANLITVYQSTADIERPRRVFLMAEWCKISARFHISIWKLDLTLIQKGQCTT